MWKEKRCVSNPKKTFPSLKSGDGSIVRGYFSSNSTGVIYVIEGTINKNRGIAVS